MKGLALACLLLSACAAVSLPDAVGKGVTVHNEPPLDAELVGAPSWQLGTEYTFVRGGNGLERYTEVIEGPTADTLGLREGTGVVRLFDRELGRLGEVYANSDRQRYVIEPADVQCAWPLWVGKRWTSNFVIKASGRAVEVEADYFCDAEEYVRTTKLDGFYCLRIWRHARVAGDLEAERTTSVAWYSPTIGYFARRLADGVVTDCVNCEPGSRKWPENRYTDYFGGLSDGPNAEAWHIAPGAITEPYTQTRRP